ncbi:YicC/YloC family endoribonuclease [Comamonas kerstersii]|uniref:YicC family protein n=1 Tax=Comamonas kerstersii TaxID=225992 RepID=A0A6A1R6X0_9BURK|nr:YicC/YloC family endoribonuclease [Comamonas kerstersii]KAB0588897.1 YicC family protein [Comamonas kerstersii]MDO4968135.1 YicC/YloC family endoribonuclease [Comamonadaceae bacterium]HBW62691.1 YicC family protein [Comamonas kerstersii]
MTGYASVQHAPASTEDNASASRMRLGLEIRAVNSRFLDLTFRLPDELRSQEPALRALLTNRLKRGKVEVRAAIDVDASASLPQPTAALLQRMQSLQDLVQAWLPDAKGLSVADALRFSGNGHAVQVDWQEIVPALADKAIDELVDARAREGKRLASMLLDRIQQLRALAEQAGPLVPQLVEQQRQRFLERWQEAMGLTEGQVAPEAARERALSEATAFAIRIDVAEEITRLGSHLDEVERLLKKGGEIGKRLDFLIQEMHREANTLGSKSATLELTRISVDMKVLIEQMREQVQNIE